MIRLVSAARGQIYQTDISQTFSGTVNLSEAHVNGSPGVCRAGTNISNGHEPNRQCRRVPK